MSAEALAAVQAVLAEWSSPDGRLFVEADERADFDADIAAALTPYTALRSLPVRVHAAPGAKFLTPEGDQIGYRVTVTES